MEDESTDEPESSAPPGAPAPGEAPEGVSDEPVGEKRGPGTATICGVIAALTEFTDNVRILDAVEAAELLPGHAANRLKEAYLSLRAEWHRSVLDIPDTERAAQTLARYRDDVSAIWESVFDDG